MEKIDEWPSGEKKHSSATRFLLAAITKGAPIGSFSMPLEISFSVNGIDLPFLDTVEEFSRRVYSQYNDSVETRARQIAEEIVTGSKINPIADALAEVQRRLGEVLDDAFLNYPNEANKQ